MRIIGGSGNWRLKTEYLEGGGIGIIRAVTPDEKASIPERLFDEDVTAIAHHALAPGEWEPDEGDIIITSSPQLIRTAPARERLIADSGRWDNQRLRELLIPGSVTEVGNYAFHNLRRLEILGLSDSILSWGSGAVSGCRRLSTIYVECRSGDIEANPVSCIVQDTSRELEAILQCGSGTTRLIFPEYEEVFEETPHNQAQYLQFHLTGAGYPYHHSFSRGRLSLKDYDSLWDKYLTMGYELNTALRLALSRLLYPTVLEERSASRYREFIAAHPDEALTTLMQDGDYAGLGLLLSIASPSEASLKTASRMATEAGRTEAKALILYALHERFPAGD